MCIETTHQGLVFLRPSEGPCLPVKGYRRFPPVGVHECTGVLGVYDPKENTKNLKDRWSPKYR